MVCSLFFVFLLFAGSTFADDPLVVNTTGGRIRGFTYTSRNGTPFLAFTGIPYAKPPEGPLRFQPPEEPEPWTGIRNSMEQRPLCIQYNAYLINATTEGVEDCLYLSVFTHSTRGRRPVLFHIHGGGFTAGFGQNAENMKAFMDEDIVIVDIQYRLGIMGFLSFEDRDMPGNQGMKDQTMALQWVKKNIARFGGNPNMVTIQGESAGAGSVYHHTLSPLSKGLFHRAIAESGTSYNPWAIVPRDQARTNARRLASMLSCPQNSTLEAVACLQKMDAKKIVDHLQDFEEWRMHPIRVFQPVLEPEGPGAFLTEPMSKWHSTVPLLMGMNSAEGLVISIDFLGVNFKWFNDNFSKAAAISMLYSTSASDPDKVSEKIRNFYFGNKEITMESWFNLTNAYSDSLFNAGILEAANKRSGKVYFYLFDYIGNKTTWQSKRSLEFGAPHGEEIQYTYRSKGLEGKDLELSKELVKMWSGFVKTGIATSPVKNEVWRTWTPTRNRYMHISNSGFKAEEGLLEDRYAFWKDLDYRNENKWL